MTDTVELIGRLPGKRQRSNTTIATVPIPGPLPAVATWHADKRCLVTGYRIHGRTRPFDDHLPVMAKPGDTINITIRPHD